jgi:heme iron utilization protein
MKNTPERRTVEHVQKRKSLMLATVDADGFPTVSYAPFVKYGDSYYIYTSGLSQHTQDLLATKKASVMFIDDEGYSRNQFARRRYTCPCTVEIIKRDSGADGDWQNVMNSFEKKFGKTFDLIRPLQDFVLFRLDPCIGKFVEGFGRAFEVGSKLQWSKHIAPNPK